MGSPKMTLVGKAEKGIKGILWGIQHTLEGSLCQLFIEPPEMKKKDTSVNRI